MINYLKQCGRCKKDYKTELESQAMCHDCNLSFGITRVCAHCGASFFEEKEKNYCKVCSELLIQGGGTANMVKLSDFAENFEPNTTTKNIADLDEVSVDLDLIDDEFEFEKDGEKKIVKQKVIIIEDIKYRVPNSVIGQLKIVLEDNPSLKKFKVRKTGSNLDTRYQLIPLIN